MSVVPSHRLGDAELHAKLDPSLERPPKEILETLEPGDLVMLLDEIGEHPEPLWVEVSDVLGPGWYLGLGSRGEPVEFRSDHVAGFVDRPFEMGASFFEGFRPKGDPFDIFRPDQPPPATQIEPPVAGSPFEVFRPKAGRGVKGGFFGLFKRRPKTSYEPIPPEERHREEMEFPKLEAPPVIYLPYHQAAETREEEPLPEIEVPEEAAPPPMPVIQTPELPQDLFSVLAPEEGEIPSAPPPSGALSIIPEAPPPPPMEIAPATGLPDLFSVLAPEAPPASSGGLAPLESTAISSGIPENLFDVLAPEERGMALPGEISPFNVLAPETGPGGMVVREERPVGQSLFDVLPAEAPPPPPPPRQEERTVFQESAPPPSPEKKKKSAQKKASRWTPPSVQEMVEWIRKTYKFPDLWKYVESERNSEYFVEVQERYADGNEDEAPIIPIETWNVFDWPNIFHFFDIPDSVWEPYWQSIIKAEDEHGYADEEWEMFNEAILAPLGDTITEAFSRIKPASLPGDFTLGDDHVNGTWGLFYFEELSPKDLKKRKAEARAAAEVEQRAAKEWEKEKKAELRRIWGKMPGPEDLVPWIESQFDVDAMFRDIQKARRSKGWKTDLREYGEAKITLEVIADLGPKKNKDYEYGVASYFGIPPQIVEFYEKADSSQELWDDIFWAFFQELEASFDMLLPSADLPGRIVVDEDDEDRLVIMYVENEESED